MRALAVTRTPLVAVILTVSTLVLARTATQAVRQAPGFGVQALPAVPFLQALSVGYGTVAADIAWMQAVQYYGEFRQGGNDLSQFDHFLEAVLALDPRFVHAYWFGAVVTASDGGDLERALELLRRGARANPDAYLLPFYMGFLTYTVGGDLEAAAQYFRYAAQWPEGHDRALRFEAFLNRRLGRLETAWALWNELYRTTDDANLRVVAAENLRKLEARMGASP